MGQTKVTRRVLLRRKGMAFDIQALDLVLCCEKTDMREVHIMGVLWLLWGTSATLGRIGLET